MNNTKSIFWAWAVKSAVTMICFTALAIFFGKWWIVLFAALFSSEVRTTGRGDNNDRT